ncbi:MAG TPA: VOC family protein [Ktedonobacterales bacterium]|nr:VOC family protein [Ktedonobacterales bacterium]
MAQTFPRVTSAPSSTPLPNETTLGPARLIVSDLQRSVAFYTETLGFTQAAGTAANGEASLTIGSNPAPILRLTELQGAQRKPAHATGLYHVAILTPSRLDLARSLYHLAMSRYPLQGASDHLVSEALYLADPDGNGLEIYRDRPRAEWPRDGDQLLMDSVALDLDALLDEAAADPRPWTGMATDTRVGHVHLHVAHLAPAVAFYREVIGLDLMIQLGGSAAFMSAGGYHHHLGLNTWAGVGAPPPPADAVGIRIWDMLLPARADIDAVATRLEAAGATYEREADGAIVTRDPSGNALRLWLLE